jgi:CelD/BcsL family acetyltransferase involved in cellulose biosynthesis
MQSAEPPITVFLEKIPPLAELAAEWRELETRATPSFFLTWTWIGNWLIHLGSHVDQGWLLGARRQGQLVGLAVVFDAPIRRRLLPMGRAAYVNETGVAAFDELCIEHNGLLLATSCAPAARAAMLAQVFEANTRWREVHVRHADQSMAQSALQWPGKAFRRDERRECHWVDLSRVRARDGDYVSLLSASRRAHIRRCLRAYAEVGPLQLTVAPDVPTALAYLNRLTTLHDRRWAERGGGSAFSGAFCRAFHERLVANAMPRGEAQLIRVMAGERELGYLYSFVYQGRVSFYQSGYDYHLLDPKFSPGLVTLALAIKHNAAAGLGVFDFLAGDQAYKASLATDRAELVNWVVQRRSLLSATEKVLRWKLQLSRRGWALLRRVGGFGAVAAVVCLGALTAGTEVFDEETGDVFRELAASALPS